MPVETFNPDAALAEQGSGLSRMLIDAGPTVPPPGPSIPMGTRALPRSVNRRTLPDTPGMGATVGATFRTSWVGEVLRFATDKVRSARQLDGFDFTPVEGFNVHRAAQAVWDSMPVRIRSRYLAGDYDETRSPTELAYRMRRDLEAFEAEETLAQAGLGKSLLAGLLVGTTDPLNLLAGFGLARLGAASIDDVARGLKTVARVRQSGRLGRVATEVGAGAFVTLTGESIASAMSPARDADDVLATLAFSTMLDASVVSFISAVGRGFSPRLKRASGERLREAVAADEASSAAHEVLSPDPETVARPVEPAEVADEPLTAPLRGEETAAEAPEGSGAPTTREEGIEPQQTPRTATEEPGSEPTSEGTPEGTPGARTQPRPRPEPTPAPAPAAPEPFRLPRELAGARPRFGQVQLVFDSDLDRALYVVAHSAGKRSKQDAAYLAALRTHTGLSEAEIRTRGDEVRSRVKSLLRTQGIDHNAGPITAVVPKERRATPLRSPKRAIGAETAKPGSPWPERPTLTRAAITGRTENLVLAGGSEREFTYAVVEADDLIPTHDARKQFAPNEAGDVNERPYQDPDAGRPSRKTVREIADNPKPAILLADTPTATDGPTITTEDFRAVGGNARAMALQLAYSKGKASAYREALIGKAAQFGLDPNAVAEMQSPVLVRRLVGDPGNRGDLSRVLNESLTTGRTRAADAVSRGTRMTPEVIASITNIIGDGSLAEALSNPRSAMKIVGALREAGAVGKAEEANWVQGGELTPDGKVAIENAIIGSIVPDVRTLTETAASTRQMLVRAIGPWMQIRKAMADVDAAESLDVDAIMDNALQIVAARRQTNALSVDDLLEQGSLQPEPWRSDTRAISLAKLIEEGKPLVFARKMRSIAELVRESASGQILFGMDRPIPVAQAFDDALTSADESPSSLFAMGAAAAGEVREVDYDAHAFVRPEEIDDSTDPRLRGAIASAAIESGRWWAKINQGARITPGPTLRFGANKVGWVLANIFYQARIPLSGHVTGARLYTAETIEGVLRHTGIWKNEIVRLGDETINEITTLLGQSPRWRQIGEELGAVGLRNDARLIYNDGFLTFDRMMRARRRAELLQERLDSGDVTETLSSIEGERDALRAQADLLQKRHERFLARFPEANRAEIERIFTRHVEGRNEIAARAVVRTPAGEAIEAMHRANKNNVVVLLDPERIKTAADLDRAVRAIHDSQPFIDEEIPVKDSRFWATRQPVPLDASDPRQLRLIIEEINRDQPIVSFDAVGSIIDPVIANDQIILSTLDTVEWLSGRRREAIAEYFLDVIARELKIGGRFERIGELQEFMRRWAADAGIKPGTEEFFQSEAAVRVVGEQWRGWFDDDAKRPPAGSVAERLLGGAIDFVRGGAGGAYLVKVNVDQITQEGQRTVGLALGRSGRFRDGTKQLASNLRLWWKKMPEEERAILEEWLGQFAAISERRPGRGFEVLGYDPVSYRPMTTRDALITKPGASEWVASIMAGLGRNMARLTGEGRFAGVTIPGIRQFSVDYIARMQRQLAIISKHQWAYDRLEDFATIDRAMRRGVAGDLPDAVFAELGDAPTPARAIEVLREAGLLNHPIRPGDYAEIKRHIDSEALEELARRRREGDSLDEASGIIFFAGGRPEETMWRAMLDDEALFRATTTPTAADIPLIAQRQMSVQEKLAGALIQFWSYPMSFLNQYVAGSRVGSASSQFGMMGTLIAGSALTLFARDVLFYDFDTATERLEKRVSDPRAASLYAIELIDRSGYLGVAGRQVSNVARLTLGDAMTQRFAADSIASFPALGFTRDFASAVSIMSRMIGGDDLGRADWETLRRVSVVTNITPLRTLINLIADPEMPGESARRRRRPDPDDEANDDTLEALLRGGS